MAIDAELKRRKPDDSLVAWQLADDASSPTLVADPVMDTAARAILTNILAALAAKLEEGGMVLANIAAHQVTTPIRACDAWTITKILATIDPAALFTTPTKCVSVDINNSDVNNLLYLGVSLAAIADGQYRTIRPGGSLTVELGPGVVIYGRAASSTVSVEFTVVRDTTV